MQHLLDENQPIVIGGVGGSGTRIVAELLLNLRFYLGNDLNEANDNLLYTLLLKRPRWFYRYRNNTRQLAIGFNLLKKVLCSNQRFSIQEWLFLQQALISMSMYGHNQQGDGKGTWSLMRLQKIFHQQISTDFIGWGWKEPNSHLLLKPLANFFCGLKYIHVIRHGLDMAYSQNQQQFYNWAALYGVNIPASASEIPLAAFRYWLAANEQAVRVGEQLGEQRFLLVNFDQLCMTPQSEISRSLCSNSALKNYNVSII